MKFGLHAFRIGVTILALVSTTTTMAAPVHKVTQGDSLWSISRKYHVSIDSIKRSNGVSSNKPLKLGLALTIPSGKKVSTSSRKQAHKHSSAPKAHKTSRTYAATSKRSMQSRASVVRTALAYRGKRYVRGGTGRNGFDCSGFTRFVYAKHGISLPHQSGAQFHRGTPVSKSALKAGDLVFFGYGRRGISHVGLYIGNKRFVHAARPGKGVIVSSLNEAYYAGSYRGARRLKK